MQRRQFIHAATASLALPTLGHAQSWPDRPIRVVVPFPAGGATDLWARLVTEPMAAEIGQPFIIENRAGAGGMIGTEAVAKGPADGNTILFTIASYVQSPVVLRRWPYQLSDFAPIGRLGGTPLPFCIRADIPCQTLAEFVAWAKGKDLPFGTYSPGSSGHAFGQLLSDVAGLNMTAVHYRGEAPMLADVLGGRVACAFHSMTGSGDHIRGGRLRPLATLGREGIPSLPQVPTFASLGYSDDFATAGFIGMLAPARTPAPIHARFATAFRNAMARPETQRRLRELDTNPGWLGPEDFAQDIENYMRFWSSLVTRMNLTADG